MNITLSLTRAPRKYRTLGPFDNLADAQIAYCEARDLTRLGHSKFSDAIATDAAGEEIARISYNGRVWPTGEWFTGMKRLQKCPCITNTCFPRIAHDPQLPIPTLFRNRLHHRKFSAR